MTLKEFRSILIFVMEARFQLATLFSDAYVYNLPSFTANDAPDFVENRFFCESARNKPLMRYSFDGFLANDALWDGKECAMSSCCDLNKPPWFITELETDVQWMILSFGSAWIREQMMKMLPLNCGRFMCGDCNQYLIQKMFVAVI